ncbi:hypothetical protein GCM10008910_04150 [Faecalicatena orotica]
MMGSGRWFFSGPPDIKVIIRAVEIRNRQVALADTSRMFKDPFLECLLIFARISSA